MLLAHTRCAVFGRDGGNGMAMTLKPTKSAGANSTSPDLGSPAARNGAKRSEHGFGVPARAQRSEHVRP